MANVVASRYQNFKAPKSDRTSLVSPSVDEAVQRLRSEQTFDDSSRVGHVEFCGKSFEIARKFARQEIVQLARDYTRQYSDLPSDEVNPTAETPIILSGHQPELFHPGVWFKNFVLDAIRRKSDGIGINFLVDNDLCRGTAIRVPEDAPAGGNGSNLARVDVNSGSVAFDLSGEAVPWELRGVVDREKLRQFPHAVREKLSAAIQSPLMLDAIWPAVNDAVDDGWQLGQALARGRHTFERSRGSATLEVPLSQIAQTRSFARFSIQLLSQLPRFHEVYNDQLLRYRAAHKIRNHAHPVPELQEEAGWVEAPMWVYRTNAPARQRLWVRVEDDELHLSDRAGWTTTITGRLDCDQASSQWLKLAEDGAMLRPRALLTTMFMRLFVGDLFVHGIGGAKYDQLTDTIIEEFFAFKPPPMCVATATVEVPLASRSPSVRDEEVEQIRDRIWRLKHNPEQVLRLDGQAGEQLDVLAKQKSRLIKEIPDRGERWQWHTDLKSIREQLALLAAPAVEDANVQLSGLEKRQRIDAIHHSREYSFAVFPADMLFENLRALL